MLVKPSQGAGGKWWVEVCDTEGKGWFDLFTNQSDETRAFQCLELLRDATAAHIEAAIMEDREQR